MIVLIGCDKILMPITPVQNFVSNLKIYMEPTLRLVACPA